MPNSKLDPHAEQLLLRARQGYTLRMLQLYLQLERSCHITQASLSRWLAKRRPFQQVQLETDGEYRRYQELARQGHPQRPYRRALTRWLGHIHYLRSHGATLPEIQSDLQQRGISTSIRSLHRALESMR